MLAVAPHPSPAVRLALFARLVEAWNPWEHARWPKGHPNAGRFAPMLDRLRSAVREFSAGRGGDRKSPMEGFTRDQLVKAAKDAGVDLKRGESQESIADRLTELLRAEVGADDVAPRSPARARQDLSDIDVGVLRALSRDEAKARIDQLGREERAFLAEDLGLPVGASKAKMLAALHPAAPKPSRGKTPFNTADVSAHLSQLTTREDAKAYLDGLNLTGPQLKELAKATGTSLTGVSRKDQFADRIVEHMVGFRQNSATLQKPWTEHPDDSGPSVGLKARTESQLDNTLRTSSNPAELAKAAEEWGQVTGGKRHQWLTAYGGDFERMARDNQGTNRAMDARAIADRVSELGSESEIIDALDGQTGPSLRRIGAELGVRIPASMKDNKAIRAHLARSLMAFGSSEVDLRPAAAGSPARRRADSGSFDASPVGAAAAVPGDLPDADVRQRITDVAARISRRPGDLVSLVRLRAEMADIPREQQDRILKQMDRERLIQLEPDPNQRLFTPEIREAAVRLGGADKHFVVLRGGPSGGGAGPKA